MQLRVKCWIFMMSEYGVLPFIKRTAFIICFSVVFYLTIKEIVRYNTNDDSSSISYKKFNDSPKDKYPVITLCFLADLFISALLLGDDAMIPRFCLHFTKSLLMCLNLSRYW